MLWEPCCMIAAMVLVLVLVLILGMSAAETERGVE
jgi:hypothetical protein